MPQSRRIGWSKYGPIAAITQDSRAVKAYCLIRESKTGRWQLSKAAPLKIPEGHDLEFKHVSWSFMGSDLAIVDARGRILIYNCALGHCHMDLRRDCSNDANDEMSSIVGMHWLPPYPAASKVTAYWSAISEGGKWTWNRDEHKGTGPSNPVEGKTALFCMNRGGRLRLLYQLADGHWRECVALVDDATYDSERYITHASFAPENDDKHMQLVTYDSHYTLRLYTVEVNWGASKDAQESQGKSLSLNPSLKVSPVDVEPHCVPNGTDQTDPADMAGLGLGDGIHYVLTHLEIVPPALDTGSAGQRLNSVLAVFKNVPLVIPSTNDGTQPSSLSPSTLVWTWQLQPATTGNLSSSFDQLSAKKKSTDSVKTKSSLTLIKQESNAFLNTVLLVTPLRYNTIIALTMADGSVEFLRRDSMQPIQADYNDSEVYSLPQSGFAFMSGESVVNVELSPNGCMQAYQDLEGKLKLRTITSTASDLVNPVSAERRKAIATSLALQWASGLLQMRSFLDDILALLVPNADPELIFEFTEQAVNAMGHNLDFSADDPQKPTIMLFRTPWLQRFFGTQAALGMTRHGRRTLAAKLALVTLNVRLSAFVIMMSFRHDLSLKSGKSLVFHQHGRSLSRNRRVTLNNMRDCLHKSGSTVFRGNCILQLPILCTARRISSIFAISSVQCF